MIVRPSVGRNVWFYPQGRKPGDQPWPAFIAYVWSDSCINVGVFDANGRPISQPPTSVRLVQEGEELPGDGPYCTWMP